jgi:toxin ParE1/3/4
MARYRLTKSARGDIGSILRASEERHGRDARARYSVHVIFYRVVQPGIVEIVRVLHDRMEPRRHLL